MRRSDNITAGPERMPNRSLLRACGMTDEEMKQPIIGVVSAYSEIIPGHINLDKIADAVKAGVRMAGGTPVLVPAIGVCDGIAMGHIGMKYSLASRELIADSVETLAQAHQLDGWFKKTVELLRPLYEELKKEVFSCDYVQAATVSSSWGS